jgi:photosystem II stability/assembly factor-like uncharacterized protein
MFSLRKSPLPLLFVALVLMSASTFAQWIPLGPDGGDVRSVTYDPHHPDRIYLGTSAGQLYISNDNGKTWTRHARLGNGNDYVLDNMEIDPSSGTFYVAAWSIEQESGDLFRSDDGGCTWKALPEMHGKSIRAMTLAPSDPKTVIVGALDGVFRSRDAGNTWQRISPEGHAEIKNIESIAIDPKNPEIVYAGTWHLAWKTENGGRDWHSIKQGVIDDSDVFSIIVDYNQPQTVYLSACSGIYKSENAAELFRKVQGIPFSARRTRVLKQDPINPDIVYAGTTEGLWKTQDAGKTWRRISAANVIVNDVHVDPRNASRLLIATDRSGVLASDDAGQTFTASNRGFAHRQVSSVLVDRFDPQTLYVGLVNDKEFGGVFISHDSGQSWQQVNAGIQKLDVFALAQADKDRLLAGTNHGIFQWTRDASEWKPMNVVAQEKVAARTNAAIAAKAKTPAFAAEPTRSELNARVAQLQVTGKKWFAATSQGLFTSVDVGSTWQGGPVLGHRELITVQASGDTVLAATLKVALISANAGQTWSMAQLPSYITVLYGGAITPDNVLWLATREGVVRSRDMGATWEHVLGGLPTRHITSVSYDVDTHRLLAVSGSGTLHISSDAAASWRQENPGFFVRHLTASGGRIFAATAFDGVVARSDLREPEPQQQAVEHLQQTEDRTNPEDVKAAKGAAPERRNQTDQDSSSKRHRERPPQHAYRARF